MTNAPVFTYRGGAEKLPFCPRCAVTCGCGGHRVAQSSQAVPRTTLAEGYVDMGFWCWCCFSQTWDNVHDTTKAWLVDVAATPGWVRTPRLIAALDEVRDDWAEACRSKNFGCEWVRLQDDGNLELRPAPGVADMPFASDQDRTVAVNPGMARLIERAQAKYQRANARG